MSRQKNRNVVFTGTLKTALRKLPARKFCTSRKPLRRIPVVMEGGPLDGITLYLCDLSGTLPITMNGQAGRYVGRHWAPAA